MIKEYNKTNKFIAESPVKDQLNKIHPVNLLIDQIPEILLIKITNFNNHLCP